MSPASLQLQPLREATPLSELGGRTALDRYQVLDKPHEPAFDRIVRLAALLLGVPIALISLIDAERQWFKARYGLDALETPRALAVCDHATVTRPRIGSIFIASWGEDCDVWTANGADRT